MKSKKTSGGAAPFGFIRTADGFAHHDTEAPIRKLIFSLFLKHKRKLTVANTLNDQGYSTRSGAKFSDTTIDRFLRDPIVLGQHKDNYIPGKGEKQYRSLKPLSERRYPAVPPLIDQATWNQVWDILHNNSKNTAKKSNGFFGDKLRCKCGGKLSHPQDRQYYYCNKCDNRIEKEIIHPILRQQLQSFTESQIQHCLIKLAENLSDSTHLQAELKKQMKELESKLSRLYEIYMNGALSPTQFKQKNAPLQEEHLSISEKLTDLTRSTKLSSDNSRAAGAPNSETVWDQYTENQQYEIISHLVHEIVVGIDTVDITFTTKPNSL